LDSRIIFYPKAIFIVLYDDKLARTTCPVKTFEYYELILLLLLLLVAQMISAGVFL
jgi:hypothetical protein